MKTKKRIITSDIEACTRWYLNPISSFSVLAEFGISKWTSMRSQKLASVPAAAFKEAPELTPLWRSPH
jgi:hypothetical protein